MKVLVLLFILISSVLSSQYTFLVNKYNKEIELEAKIIFNIASLISKNEEIKLYIPNISEDEKSIYSKFFKLSETCESSDFVFIKKVNKSFVPCKGKNKYFFTNNYKKLLNNEEFFGAFFWTKSRPNIVFIKNRLESRKISLPKNYQKFIEDF
ncbi:hypothetical protein [Malaciobacter mytili]|uniref:Uncharacterized protein n=1 Tax=Malaciobacter mytili LMG 24559 TaxID=1032238 RepID=A0AAX2AGQ7_9BACT|nr:hypothetical protein [Malaciobacter mytili]AXH15384.1 hypothetical protein AMYT_1813 [Malaciobacter mytili LMG 24559]RXK15830.1 hypothetical protein CP985_06540 [Malaciobacter mytili LMG 24559]